MVLVTDQWQTKQIKIKSPPSDIGPANRLSETPVAPLSSPYHMTSDSPSRGRTSGVRIRLAFCGARELSTTIESRDDCEIRIVIQKRHIRAEVYRMMESETFFPSGPGMIMITKGGRGGLMRGLG